MVDIEPTDLNDNVIEITAEFTNNSIETNALYGPQGNGIASIIKTSSNGLTDTYTITFTNDSTTTFDVTNGKGIVSFELSSSTELTDTYTISYNDGTSTSFTVTNDVEGVSVVAENIDIVSSVGNNISNVNAVAEDLTNIDAIAADLTNIDAASSNAALAKDWANKTTGSVDGVEYSAKYYAQQAAQGQVQANWNEVDTTSKSYIQNKPSLAAVATSGAYSDLTGVPTIPTVNNATLTIQKNGMDVQSFTANASSNVTCNITVPTNTNELTNGAGFITGISSSDVTTALSYTPADVSLSNANDTAKILMSGMSMPSGTAEDLTLPANEGTVQAPADGWIFLVKAATAAGQYIRLEAGLIAVKSIAQAANNNCAVSIPIKANAYCTVKYTATGGTSTFRFVYAEGSTSLSS